MTFLVTSQTLVGDILDKDSTTSKYFFEIGMECVGCPCARGETLEEACQVHSTDVDSLVQKLNAHFEA
ncbi:MAG: DUF1858 domain-containing protein [Oscillospiraceae bacterium]